MANLLAYKILLDIQDKSNNLISLTFALNNTNNVVRLINLKNNQLQDDTCPLQAIPLITIYYTSNSQSLFSPGELPNFIADNIRTHTQFENAQYIPLLAESNEFFSVQHFQFEIMRPNPCMKENKEKIIPIPKNFIESLISYHFSLFNYFINEIDCHGRSPLINELFNQYCTIVQDPELNINALSKMHLYAFSKVLDHELNPMYADHIDESLFTQDKASLFALEALASATNEIGRFEVIHKINEMLAFHQNKNFVFQMPAALLISDRFEKLTKWITQLHFKNLWVDFCQGDSPEDLKKFLTFITLNQNVQNIVFFTKDERLLKQEDIQSKIEFIQNVIELSYSVNFIRIMGTKFNLSDYILIMQSLEKAISVKTIEIGYPFKKIMGHEWFKCFSNSNEDIFQYHQLLEILNKKGKKVL